MTYLTIYHYSYLEFTLCKKTQTLSICAFSLNNII